MADPVVHLTNGLPDSGTGNITTLGMTLADGANATLGATTDAAVAAGAPGSLSAKLRSISRDIVSNIVLAAGANVIGAVTQSGSWVLSAGAALIGVVKVGDGTNTVAVKAASTAPLATDPAIVVAISPNSVNANGQTTMSASAPVVIASDQSAVAVKGSAASGATASGNPVPTAGLAVSSETVVTNGQAAAMITDLARKLIVLPYANPENFVSGAITTAMTSTTSTSLVAAPAAGLRNYITTIICSNAHATVGTDIAIQDGSGGTTLLTIPAAAVYGGAVITLPTPLRQPTTATALYCANVTTGASTKVSAVGYKGA